MSKLETPMIERYWNRIGGTLSCEFRLVPRAPGQGRRLIDAVILPDLPFVRAHWRDVKLEGRNVVAVQAKAHRLGMYLMGQAIFSAELLKRRFAPAAVRSVILCSRDDLVLRECLTPYPEVEVEIDTQTPTMISEEEMFR